MPTEQQPIELPVEELAEKEMRTVGTANINGSELSLGVSGEEVNYDTEFHLMRADGTAISPDTVSLRICAMHRIGYVGQKYPVYAELKKPTNTRELVDYLLVQSGFREPPIVATETNLCDDAKLQQVFGLGAVMGWRLKVRHDTEQTILEELGITSKQLHAGFVEERDKGVEAALEALAGENGWQDDAERANRQLRDTPHGDMFSPLDEVAIARILGKDLGLKTKGQISLDDGMMDRF